MRARKLLAGLLTMTMGVTALSTMPVVGDLAPGWVPKAAAQVASGPRFPAADYDAATTSNWDVSYEFIYRMETSDDGRFIVVSAGELDSPALLDRDGDGNGILDDSTPPEPLSLSTGISGFDTLFEGDISGDGNVVAFVGDPTGSNDYAVYVRSFDPETKQFGALEFVSGSVPTSGRLVLHPSLSTDGQKLAFWSRDIEPVGSDHFRPGDIAFHDRTTSTTQYVSVTPSNVPAAGRCTSEPTISGDGNHVVFICDDPDLVSNDPNGNIGDVFVRNMATGQTTRIAPARAPWDGGGADISGDGRFVVLNSHTTSDPYTAESNVLLHDRDTDVDGVFDESGAISSTVIADYTGTSFYGDGNPSISTDGRYAIIDSRETLPWNGSLNIYDRIEGKVIQNVTAHGSQSAETIAPVANGDDYSLAFVHSGNVWAGTFAVPPPPPPPPPPPATEVPKEQTKGDSGDHGNDTTTERADPVNTATGAFTHGDVDFTLPGKQMPLSFGRTYNSNGGTTGALGHDWRHDFEFNLIEESSGDIRAITGDGKEIVFALESGGMFAAPPAITSTLVAVAGGYELTSQEQVTWHFDTAGVLQSISNESGNAIALSYTDNVLTSITDTTGSVTTLDYNTGGKLEQVNLPDGRSVSYGYGIDDEGNTVLTSFTDVRGKTWEYEYEGEPGRLTKIIDPNNHDVITNEYNYEGRVVEQIDQLGNHTTFSWDKLSQTSTMTDAAGEYWIDYYAGNILTRSKQPNGRIDKTWDADLNPTSVLDPNGKTWTYTYDANGNVLTRTAPSPLGYVDTYAYDVENHVTSHTDGRNNTTTYGYDTDGNVTTITRPGNRVETFTYDGDGQMLTSTDANDHTTTYTYDGDGNRTSVTDPENNESTFTYDNRGFLTSTVDPRGNVSGANPADFTTAFEYDTAGNRIKVIDSLDRETTITYDNAGNLKTKTDPAGHTTTYSYNAADELTEVKAPDNTTLRYEYDERGLLIESTTDEGWITTYGYDGAGRRISVTDPRGNVVGANPADYTTTFTYDANGNQTATVDPLGNKATFTYDAASRMTSMVDPRGNVIGANPVDYTTTFTYDANGNKVTATDPLGNVTTSSYDDLDRLAAITNPRGKVTTFSYDDVGNQLSSTDPMGNVASSVYDDANRLVGIVDPRGNASGANPADYTTSYTYDPAGNQTTVTDPLGNDTTKVYDAAGQLTSVTDANNHTTTFGYTPKGQVDTVTAPGNATTNYDYDEVDNLTSRTDPNSHTTTWSYDDDRRLTSKKDSLNRTWSYDYDPAGNRISQVDAIANAASNPTLGTTTWSYDRASRLTGIGYSDTTPDVVFNYDAAGNRTSMIDGTGMTNNTFDRAARLTKVTKGADVYTYAYDKTSNVTSRQLPGGTSATYTYDNANRMASMTAGGLITSYSYDKASNLTQSLASNGVKQAVSYDRVGRATTIANTRGSTNLSTFTRTLDPVGNPTNITRTGTLPATATLTHDNRDRLTGVDYDGSIPDLSYGYDAVGNRSSETRGGTETTYTYDAADQLTSSTTGGSTTNFSYDGNGRQVQKGTQTFGYDQADRLISSINGGITTTYAYDGNNNRTSTTTGAQTTTYKWDVNNGLPRLTHETTGANAAIYHYGLSDTPDLLISGGSHVLADDFMGSVVNVTSATGQTERSIDYDPYGSVRVTQDHNPTAPASNLGFTGGINDPASGLLNLRARNYDTTTGRFTSTDPLDPEHGTPYVCAYAYVNNRPMVMTDPSGMRGEMQAPDTSCAAGAAQFDQETWEGLQAIVSDPGIVADAIDATNKEAGGGWRGALAVANLANPAYHLMQDTYDLVSAWARHDCAAYVKAAAHFVADALAFGGVAKLASKAGRKGGDKPSVRPAPDEPSPNKPNGGYPPNDGFLNPPIKMELPSGHRIDRYGGETSGRFVSPQGTPFPKRSLPGEPAEYEYHVYEVQKSFIADYGHARPWFDQPGLGNQYKLPKTIAELLESGHLRRIQ